MALNKYKFNRKVFLQISLFLLGTIIIFFTYFNKDKDETITGDKVESEIKKIEENKEGLNTFENITYEGIDSNNNKFVIDADYAEFTADEANIIYMKGIVSRFFFKDGTILRITSNKGIYDNITNDIEFEENVKMYYLENKLFSEKASYKNSENYLLVQGNVIGEGPQGDLVADKLNLDLIEKKMKISMYNQSKVNIKVNY